LIESHSFSRVVRSHDAERYGKRLFLIEERKLVVGTAVPTRTVCAD
jgi:hypothetical protein